LRYTPAGIPVLDFTVVHRSQQFEAGKAREVEVEMACVVVETLATLMAKALEGDGLSVHGFLVARSLKRRTPVLHVTQLEFIEGNKNGF
jgi:primosomal replication protein N